jgi:hypothetical protein
MEINHRARRVHGPIQIFPAAFDFHIGLIESLARTERELPSTKPPLQQWGMFDDTTVERQTVDIDTAVPSRE